MDGDRRRLALGVVVGLLLLLSGVLPHPVFGSPYETGDPEPYFHQAVPEDDELYDRFVDLYDFDTTEATPVEELSPTGQLVVERTLDSERDGNWHRYVLAVCQPAMLVCDSVREPPADFKYGEGEPDEVFRLIEVDGEQYLFQTGVQTGGGSESTDGFGDQPLSTFIWLFGLVPFGAVVIASQAISQKTGQRRMPTALTVMGAGLFVAGLAVPYLVVLSAISYAELAIPLLIGVVGLTLVAICGLVWQTVQYGRSPAN